MSLLDLIEQQGQHVARAEREIREALDKLHESNIKLSEEIQERRRAERRLRRGLEAPWRRRCPTIDIEVNASGLAAGGPATPPRARWPPAARTT